MEVVGLCVGLVPLALQVAEGTRRLRDAYKRSGALPSKLESLAENLRLLQHVAKEIDRSEVPPDFRNAVIAPILKDVAKELDRLSRKVAKVESSRKLGVAARRVRFAPSCQDELNHLEELIHHAETKMVLL